MSRIGLAGLFIFLLFAEISSDEVEKHIWFIKRDYGKGII